MRGFRSYDRAWSEFWAPAGFHGYQVAKDRFISRGVFFFFDDRGGLMGLLIPKPYVAQPMI